LNTEDIKLEKDGLTLPGNHCGPTLCVVWEISSEYIEA